MSWAPVVLLLGTFAIVAALVAWYLYLAAEHGQLPRFDGKGRGG